MKQIKKVSDVVKQVLEDVPAARNNNDILYINVCNRYNPSVCAVPFHLVMFHRKKFNIPPFEGVARARRKVVAQYPELSGSDDVEAYREMNEEIMIDYARQVNV